jgi:hypothetical protein
MTFLNFIKNIALSGWAFQIFVNVLFNLSKEPGIHFPIEAL